MYYLTFLDSPQLIIHILIITKNNEDIINVLSANNISVVAITDHHIIDIDRITKLKELGKERDITILPGIEFCS